MYRLADLFTQSADQYLSRWFESDVIKAVLAYYSGIGTYAGPKSPGTAYVIMHHLMGEHEGAGGWGFVRGGMGAISRAIAGSGARFGLEVRTEAEIAKVLIEEGRAAGVVTRAGDEVRAPVVACNANAKILFFDLIEPRHLPGDFLDELGRFRTFSTAFKINLACERPPQYRAFDGSKCGFAYPSYVHIGPDIEYLERAYDDAKHGWYSTRPFVTPVVPTTVDDTIAPPGKHVVHLFGGHAPYRLKNATWEHERANFVRNVMGVMDAFAPGFSDDVIDMQVLLPPDIEEILNLPNGHIFHGELSVDQLFMKRPVAHFADYRTPIRGLYLCGSSAHPGGGVSGIPGHNAAREILKDLRRQRR
jgi:phytoene dehydrogenase-like protein